MHEPHLIEGHEDGAAPWSGASVRVESGFYEGLEWPLERASTVIGRGKTADLLLSEATISRAHALLAFRDRLLIVQDLGSTNGTLVNGRAEQRARLGDGDLIQMGRLNLRVQIDADADVGGSPGA